VIQHSLTNKEWLLSSYNDNHINYLREKLSLDLFTSKLLLNRGIELQNISLFLKPDINFFLPDPKILKDMEQCVEIFSKFIIENKKICIFADYDVDGACSAAIIINYLKKIYKNFSLYIPDRFKEGYGPSIDSFKNIFKNDHDLVLLLDCGTTSFDSIEYANKEKKKVLIIDHHQPESKLPSQVSIINPNQVKDNSKLNYLCAAGLAFLFILSLNKKLTETGYLRIKIDIKKDIFNLLDLVALATVCDLVPLVELNRSFVFEGLKVLKKRENLGLKTLVDSLKINEEINEYHLGYKIGPRINAGGRLGFSKLGAELLSTDDPKNAFDLANKLNEINEKRKIIGANILNEAISMVNNTKEDFIFISNSSWNEGLIGIIASSIKEQFNKPTFVISTHGNVAKGSARSVSGLDIGQIVMEAKELKIISKGGGHKMAAGFSLDKDSLVLFKNFISKKIVKKKNILKQNYITDVLSPTSLNEETFRKIKSLSPFGQANFEPFFLTKDLLNAKILFENEFIIKNLFKCNFGNFVRTTFFKKKSIIIENYLKNLRNKKLSLVGKIISNRWNNKINIEIDIEDICLA